MRPIKSSVASACGFTLVELVVCMLVATIIVGFVGMMLGTPVDAYIVQARRAELSDSAETAMRWLGEDVRKALPDSLRTATIGGSPVLEMIEVSGIANYQTVWPTGDPLQIGFADPTFGTRTQIIPSGAITHVVVGHSNVSSDVYAPPGASGVITPGSLNGAGTQVSVTPGFQFTTNSPTQRAYLVEGVTRYACNVASGELRRSRHAAIAPAPAAVVPPFDVIAREVTGCSFQVRNGTAEHGGLAMIEITISRATNGTPEILHMFRQFRVENVT